MESPCTLSEARHEAPTPKPMRRQLGPNVTCMFTDERPKIANPRIYGKKPRGIVYLPTWRHLTEGDVAVVRGGLNNGKRVRIVEYARDFEWKSGQPFWVESLDGLLWILIDGTNPDAPGNLKQGIRCVYGSNRLRKITSRKPQ